MKFSAIEAHFQGKKLFPPSSLIFHFVVAFFYFDNNEVDLLHLYYAEFKEK